LLFTIASDRLDIGKETTQAHAPKKNPDRIMLLLLLLHQGYYHHTPTGRTAKMARREDIAWTTDLKALSVCPSVRPSPNDLMQASGT
jgi:hypothetical protein